MDMLAPKSKKELQAFLGIINYLRKFSPGTTDICKVTWTWNVSYQELFDKAKSLINADMSMKFHNDTKPLYLETDASGVGLGAALLQICKGTICQKDIVPNNTILHLTAFASKGLTGAEHR